MIIDASVVLNAFFPDESQAIAQNIIRDHVTGQVLLKAPDLLHYELTNAVWQAERRKRIRTEQTQDLIEAMEGLGIELVTLEWGEMLPLARRFSCSSYDAAYLQIAQNLDEPLVTGDEKLYNAVRGQLSNVIWVGDYRSPIE